MRVFIAISIVVASVSSASAQLAMDHGNAANPKAAATASGAPQSPAQQTSFSVGSGGTAKIVRRTAEQLKPDDPAQAAWNVRCRPTVIEDRDGLRRVTYAERDCDLSRSNTAGN
jgi:hypothetical protein